MIRYVLFESWFCDYFKVIMRSPNIFKSYHSYQSIIAFENILPVLVREYYTHFFTHDVSSLISTIVTHNCNNFIVIVVSGSSDVLKNTLVAFRAYFTHQELLLDVSILTLIYKPIKSLPRIPDLCDEFGHTTSGNNIAKSYAAKMCHITNFSKQRKVNI